MIHEKLSVAKNEHYENTGRPFPNSIIDQVKMTNIKKFMLEI